MSILNWLFGKKKEPSSEVKSPNATAQEKVAHSPKKEATDLCNKAMAAIERNDISTAFQDLTRAEALDPRDPFVHLLLHQAYGITQDYDSAAKHFKELKKLDPATAEDILKRMPDSLQAKMMATSEDYTLKRKEAITMKEPVFFKNLQDGNKTYELYLEDDAEIAKTWLLTKKVEKSEYYINVKTQQGTWGMDKEGLYLTDLLPWQTDLSLAQVEGSVIGTPSMFNLGSAERGIADNFVVQVQCGKDGCSGLWHDALRYRNKTLVRCPKCSSYNVIDSSNIIYLEG